MLRHYRAAVLLALAASLAACTQQQAASAPPTAASQPAASPSGNENAPAMPSKNKMPAQAHSGALTP